MDLDTLIGARLVVGLPGLEATEEDLNTLRATHAQGLIVFERNFASVEQFTALLTRLKETLGRQLLVMVDHEGGRIIRFRSGVTRFPDARSQALLGPEAIHRQGEVEAKELRRLGVHVNLVPCVDVLIEGSDPIIGNRAYGSDPSLVSRCGVARIRGLQSRGVAACAKHFPGLGAVPRDPHKLLPTVPLGWDEMERTHLPPFRAAMDAGTALIMSSHVCYPALGDPEGLPATFSTRLIRDLLRQRLRYEGAIITDDLEMGALGALGDMGERAVRATEAGHDLLLICSGPEPAKVALASLRAAYETGRLDLKELERMVRRIERLRLQYLAG